MNRKRIDMKNSFERATSPEKLEEDAKKLKAFRSEIYSKISESPPKKNAFTINRQKGEEYKEDVEQKDARDDTHKR
jgi:hypothetical protein